MSISSYPYFAIVQINSSGIYYNTEFERTKYPSICSCNGNFFFYFTHKDNIVQKSELFFEMLLQNVKMKLIEII